MPRAGRAIAVTMATAVAMTIAAGAVARAAPSPTAVGFAHHLHDRNLVVAGAESLPCARCHAMKRGALVGKPDHAACFGACHGAPPRRGDKPGQRLAVCTACHAEATVVRARRSTFSAISVPPRSDTMSCGSTGPRSR